MKKLFLFAGFAIAAVVLVAQNDSTRNQEIKTLFGSKPHSHGGFASLGVGYSQIDQQDAFTSTFRGAWLIDHTFAIGISATGFSNDLYINHPSGANISSIQGGFGGILLQPVIAPRFPVHVSFPVTLGVGGVASLQTHYYDDFDATWYVNDEAFFFIAEPGVELELNLVRFIRASFGVSYRYTSSVLLQGYENDVLHGLSGNFSLSFGKF